MIDFFPGSVGTATPVPVAVLSNNQGRMALQFPNFPDVGQPHRLLTATELGRFLAVSPSTIKRLVRDKQIAVIRIRRAIRFDRDSVVQALTDNP